MRTRTIVASGIAGLVLAVMFGAPARVAGQNPTTEAAKEAARKVALRSEEESAAIWAAEVERNKAAAVARVYDPAKPDLVNPPRTPWGDPDLRGYYITATYTPLERPRNVDKALYTADEALNAFLTQTDIDAGADPGVVHYDWKEFGMEAWQSPVRPSLRTGLVVEPQNGRLPPLTPAAEQRRAEAAALRKQRDDQTGIGIFNNRYTRCVMGLGAIPLIRGGNPGSAEATSAGVSTEIQLFQTADYVTIVHQSNTDVRIIPVSRRAHLPEAVKQWNGNSRGHWEGNTLVVETTGIKDLLRPGGGFRGATDSATFVERFSVLDANTLRYTYTVTDPNTWTSSWTVDTHLPRIDPPLYEFACHEQNYGLINLVMGAQIRATEGVLDPRAPR